MTGRAVRHILVKAHRRKRTPLHLWTEESSYRTATDGTEFCGGCFDPDGQTFYVNQQGERGGPPDGRAVTYAIYGPFEKRFGNNGRNFGNGR